MTAVLFHTPDQTVRLSGSERAHAALLIGRTSAAIALMRRDFWMSRLTDSHYLFQVSPGALDGAFATAWSHDDLTFTFDGEEVDSFTLALNTAMVTGSDPMRLLARIHGSCEIHAWVDGPDRAWLADIVDEGLGSGLFRPGVGWENVWALMRAESDAPVVTSYTVCDPFPSENWDAAMDELRARDGMLQMRPSDWGSHRFGCGLSALGPP